MMPDDLTRTVLDMAASAVPEKRSSVAITAGIVIFLMLLVFITSL